MEQRGMKQILCNKHPVLLILSGMTKESSINKVQLRFLCPLKVEYYRSNLYCPAHSGDAKIMMMESTLIDLSIPC